MYALFHFYFVNLVRFSLSSPRLRNCGKRVILYLNVWILAENHNVNNCISFVNEEPFLLGLLEQVVNVYTGVNRQNQNILQKIFKILEQKRKLAQLNNRPHYMSLEGFYIEIYMRKKKWLACTPQNSNKILISNYLKEIDKNVFPSSTKYDNFIFLADDNTEPTKSAIRDFWNLIIATKSKKVIPSTIPVWCGYLSVSVHSVIPVTV